MMKTRVVVSGIFYPLAMLSYFVRAFQRRDDVELVTVGPFTGDYIPWGGGMRLPMKYVHTPTIALDRHVPSGLPAKVVQAQLPWTPDIWIQIDAGWYMQKPVAGKVVHVATDPHCLDYYRQRKECDIFFNMQKAYSQPGDVYLPYAYDPTVHYPMEDVEKLYDGCLVGLHYEERDRLVRALQGMGYSIHYELGKVFDEFRMAYNQSRIALNRSSLLDLNARTFEAFSMKLPLLTNRVPDLKEFFVEEEDYLGFDTVSEAQVNFKRLMDDPDLRQKMAANALAKVKSAHSYDHRVEQILQACR